MSLLSMFSRRTDETAATAVQWVDDGATLVDVRTPGEYAGGHVRGAVLAPVQELSSHLRDLPKGSKVVVYCRSGARSAQAASQLKSRGFDVCDLGSINSWPNRDDIVQG